MKAIMNFLNDERGNHILEYSGSCMIIAGGTVTTIKFVKDGMVDKLEQLSAATDVSPDGDTP